LNQIIKITAAETLPTTYESHTMTFHNIRIKISIGFELKLFMDFYVCVGMTFMLIFPMILVWLILVGEKNSPLGNWKLMRFLYEEQTSLFRQSRMLCSHIDRA